MEKIRVHTEPGRKGDVVGRVQSPLKMQGKMVFFRGGQVKAGQILELKKYEDKDRFIVASSWEQAGGPKVEDLIRFLDWRITASKGDKWKQFVRACVDESMGPEYAMSLLVSAPLTALEKVVKEEGNKELRDLFFILEKNISENKDLVSEKFTALLRGARDVYGKGGSPEDVMALPEFDALGGMVVELNNHPGQWPVLVMESGIVGNARWTAIIR